jgi:hypothetical protein
VLSVLHNKAPNAHRTVCREVLFRHHPWFECDVFVHSAIDKADGGVFRCTLDGEAGRWLEIPAWMLIALHV